MEATVYVHHVHPENLVPERLTIKTGTSTSSSKDTDLLLLGLEHPVPRIAQVWAVTVHGVTCIELVGTVGTFELGEG